MPCSDSFHSQSGVYQENTCCCSEIIHKYVTQFQLLFGESRNPRVSFVRLSASKSAQTAWPVSRGHWGVLGHFYFDLVGSFYGKLLTPWGGVLLEKLIVTQLVKLLAFYGTQTFITLFTRVRHWTLPWARWIQFTPSHTVPLRPVLILSSHIREGMKSRLLRSG
jgi:hypothetical protein